MVKILGIQIGGSKSSDTKAKALGAPILKPSEAAKQSGGYVSTTNPSIPGAYGATGGGDIKTSPKDIPTPSRGGGGGGSSPRTSTNVGGSVQEELKKTGGGSIENLRKVQTQQELRKQNLQERYNPRTNTYESIKNPYSSGTKEVVNTRLKNIPDINNSNIKVDSNGNVQINKKENKNISGIISAYVKGDELKGEEFRQDITYYKPKYGTLPLGESPYEKVSSRVDREKAVFYGESKPDLFVQDLRSQGSKILDYVPVIGTGRDLINSARELSKEYSNLRGGEQVLGLNNVNQKSFRTSLINVGLNTALFAGDVYFTGSILKSGVKVGSEFLARRNLRNVQPEIFLGLSRNAEEGNKYIALAKREAGNLKSYTLTGFDVIPTSEQIAQVQKGKGAQIILKNNKPISKTAFTFFGDVEKVKGRVVKPEGVLKISKEVKEPTSAFISNVDILTTEEIPKRFTSTSIGLGKIEGEYTKILSGQVKKGIKLKTGELNIIDLSTGKNKIIKLFDNTKIRLSPNKIDSVGVIRDFKGRSNIIDLGKNNLITVTSKNTGASISIQTESKLLETSPKLFQEEIPKIIPPISKGVSVKEQSKTNMKEPAQVNLKIENVEQNVISPTQVSSKISGTKQENKVITISRGRNKQKEEIITDSGVKNKTIQENKPQERFGKLFKVLSEQSQKEKEKNIQKIINSPSSSLKNPIIKIPKILIPLFEEYKNKKIKNELEQEEFKIFGKRWGSFKEIGKAKTQKEAEEIAKIFSLGTLGVSTSIEFKGKPIEFNLGVGFRKSKVNPFVQVQERGFRLGSFGERKEIQSERKKKSKKVRWI